MRPQLDAIISVSRRTVEQTMPADLRRSRRRRQVLRAPWIGAQGLATAAILVLLGGCAAQRPASAPSAALTTTYPATVFGIPVQRRSWRQRLPLNLGSTPWSTVAPKGFRVTPAKAISLALAAEGRVLLAGVQRIYIQPAGLVGGRTGDPSAAYVIVFTGQSLGLAPGAGPHPPQPPVVQEVVVGVDGRTGKAGLYITGTAHGSVGHALIVPTGFWTLPAVRAYGSRLDIFPRMPGATACLIPHGGPANSSSIPGGCTTQVLTGRQYVARFSPTMPLGGIWRVVLLSEAWVGPPAKPTAPEYGNNIAGWAFFLDRQGKVLRVRVFGTPPQYWK